MSGYHPRSCGKKLQRKIRTRRARPLQPLTKRQREVSFGNWMVPPKELLGSSHQNEAFYYAKESEKVE
jgi:hypothetical protein